MSKKQKAKNLTEAELEEVQGGVGLLLPAVQAASESELQGTTTSKRKRRIDVETENKFGSTASGSPNV